MATIERRVSASGVVSFRARVRRTGEPQVTKTFRRKSDAEAWARELETRADRGFALPSREDLTRTLADAVETWTTKKAPELAESDRENAKRMASWWRGELGRVALVRLTPELIDEKIAKLRTETDKEGRRVRTDARVNRYIATLSRVLGFTVRKLRWLERNPCQSVDRLDEPDGRVRYLTDDEVKALLAAVDGRRKPAFGLFVRFALYTGARRGEIAKLRWADVDTKGGRVTFRGVTVRDRVTVRGTKTATARTLPMPVVLVEAVKAFAKVQPIDGDTLVFPHDFRFDWREVQGTLPDFVFHSLRHSVASHVAMAGGSPLDIAAVTGHRTLAMVKRYSHLSDDHVRSKLEQAAARIAPKGSQ
jgi:integrase